MKDHKGYEKRPFDWQDQVVLWACVGAVAVLGLMLWGYP